MRTALLVALIIAGLGTAGCGETSSPSSSTSATSQSSESKATSGPDAVFAKNLANSHGQTIELLVAASRSKNPKVTELAERMRMIREAQVDQLAGWLAANNDKLPEIKPEDGGEPVKALKAVSDAEFDKAWAKAMTAQNNTAAALVTAEAANGADAEMKELAQSLIDTFTQEGKDLAALTG